MSSDVPTPMARGNVRCGSFASPAENVTYCQPSYAHSTPIIAAPTPDSCDANRRRPDAVDPAPAIAASEQRALETRKSRRTWRGRPVLHVARCRACPGR